jgi:hypothetical protein
MRTKIALLPLALGTVLAVPASAYAELAASGPVYTHRVIHHRSVVARAQATVPALAYAPARLYWFGDHETDGLSRNRDDCVKYGCIDNGD